MSILCVFLGVNSNRVSNTKHATEVATQENSTLVVKMLSVKVCLHEAKANATAISLPDEFSRKFNVLFAWNSRKLKENRFRVRSM